MSVMRIDVEGGRREVDAKEEEEVARKSTERDISFVRVSVWEVSEDREGEGVASTFSEFEATSPSYS